MVIPFVLQALSAVTFDLIFDVLMDFSLLLSEG